MLIEKKKKKEKKVSPLNATWDCLVEARSLGQTLKDIFILKPKWNKINDIYIDSDI